MTKLLELELADSELTERINALNIKGDLSKEEIVELREKQAESQKAPTRDKGREGAPGRCR